MTTSTTPLRQHDVRDYGLCYRYQVRTAPPGQQLHNPRIDSTLAIGVLDGRENHE